MKPTNLHVLDQKHIAVLPNTLINAVKLESFHEPVALLRIPTKGKCSVTGLCRTTLYNLTSGENPPVLSINFSEKCSTGQVKKRKGRYIVAHSLFSYLLQSSRPQDRQKISAWLFRDFANPCKWPGKEIAGIDEPPVQVSPNAMVPLVQSLLFNPHLKPSEEQRQACNRLVEALHNVAAVLSPAQFAVLNYAMPTMMACAEAHAMSHDMDVAQAK